MSYTPQEDRCSHCGLEFVPADKYAELERVVAELRGALEELVALKDLRESRIDFLPSGLDSEYQRRKPLAWAAARAALKGKP